MQSRPATMVLVRSTPALGVAVHLKDVGWGLSQHSVQDIAVHLIYALRNGIVRLNWVSSLKQKGEKVPKNMVKLRTLAMQHAK